MTAGGRDGAAGLTALYISHPGLPPIGAQDGDQSQKKNSNYQSAESLSPRRVWRVGPLINNRGHNRSHCGSHCRDHCKSHCRGQKIISVKCVSDLLLTRTRLVVVLFLNPAVARQVNFPALSLVTGEITRQVETR